MSDFTREDWLKYYGLKYNVTTDEYYEVDNFKPNFNDWVAFKYDEEDYEQHTNWFIAPKTFWNNNGYVPDWSLGFKVPDFPETMEHCIEWSGTGDGSLELRSMGFHVLFNPSSGPNTDFDPQHIKQKQETEITLKDLQKINTERSNHHFPECKDWTLGDWGNALAGEVGEACNFIKKMKRDNKDHTSDLAKELADVVCYVMLLGEAAGIDVNDAVISKFNEVSDRISSDFKIFPK